jgi:hypothetical protein
MDLGSRYFGPLENTSRSLSSYNMVRRIIYEWGTCTGAIGRFRLEVVNIEILPHVLVVIYFGCNRCGIGIRGYRNRLCNRCGIGIRGYRNRLIFKLGRNVRFD